MEVSGAVSVALDPGAEKPAPATRAQRDRLVLGFLGAALALGALRFLALGRFGLWLDEALTLADSVSGGTESNPFGYWLFDWFYSFAKYRPDEAWMRLPAAVFGCASILATFWALLPFLGARAAALAAFFVSASTWHLYWSQNARFYTLAQGLAVLGGGVLLRGLYGGLLRRTALGLFLLVLSALTHPSAAFLIGPLFLLPWVVYWFEWVPPERLRARAWSLFGLAGLLTLVIGSGWALRTWFKWEARQGTGSFFHFAKTVGYLMTPTVGLAFVFGVLRQWRDRASFVPLAAAALGLSAAALASFFVRVSAQYVFVLQPWVAACAALALAPRTGSTLSDARIVRWALLIAAPGLLEMALYFTVRNGDRPHWREAYAYVFEHRGSQDLVLGMEAPVAEYYLDPRTRTLRRWTQVTWLDDFRSRMPQDWMRYGRAVWFVVNETQLDDWTGLPDSAANRAEFQRILREECQRVADFPVPLTPRDLDVSVYLFRPGPTEAHVGDG
jgi:hypothetical protein